MIKLQNVSKVYENGTVAINDLSLELQGTGMVAITGTSGCGKSTLINLLSFNDIATGGQITYNDKNYNEIDKSELTLKFGYIYQDFKLIDNLTAYQNIMIGHELALCEVDYDLVLSIAKDLGIDDILDEKVYSLSGGQMQRVAIARALVRNPEVIFADEPTGNLDSNNSINVYNILRKLSEEKLVVIVSHDEEISTWADRVITLEDGQIISDKPGKSVSFVRVDKEEKTAEEEDIEEILLKQKNIKSKKTSTFFSYKNKPTIKHKTNRLSGKSSLALSIAMLNKDIVKKVFLTIVMVILISFMTLSCAMTFATIEKTMANAINLNDGQKIFAVKPKIEKPDYIISGQDMMEFDRILNDSNLAYYEIATGEVISNNWGSMYPNNDSIEQVVYYATMDIANMQNAIFTDDLNKIGINIIKGKAPSSKDEIAISKSYYDYLVYYKNFAIDIDDYTLDILFTENNILNNNNVYDIFGVKICGVFDDKNTLDTSLKNKKISDLKEDESESYQKLLEEEINTNPLINLVIKCEEAKEDWKFFSGVNSYTKMTIENCFGVQNSDYYFNYAPLNSATLNYYNLPMELLSSNLNKNEILINKSTLDKINTYISSRYSDAEEIAEGSILPMSIVQMATMGNSQYFPDKIYVTEQIKIAEVVDGTQNIDGIIFMSDQTYQNFNVVKKYSEKRLISGEHINSSSLKKLNKNFAKFVDEKFTSYTNNYVVYQIINCPMTKANDYGFIYICQQYLCVPLMLLTIAMAIGIIVVFYFDFVKTKAKDLLILKSLGAKTYDFFSIYGIFSVVLMIIQMIFGLLFGNLLIYLINGFGSSVSSYNGVFSIFYLDAASWVFTIFAIIIINVVSLVISLAGINNKNLRKSFQKLKK